MEQKVILILIDGMRPDGLVQCGNDYLSDLKRECSYTLSGKTVFPSITLPCHLSLFHSVPPERHGTTNNHYVEPVRPVLGLFEKLKQGGKKSAMFSGWQEMRDICKPGTLDFSLFINQLEYEHVDKILTDTAISYISGAKPDFVFLYLGETDDKGGHDKGWMSETYLEYISLAIDNVKRIIDEFGEEYTIILTADHGGHDRTHGSSMQEDMLIPLFIRGKDIEGGRELKEVSILDVAPTIASVFNISPEREWEGVNLLK